MFLISDCHKAGQVSLLLGSPVANAPFPEDPAGLGPPSTQVYKGEVLTQAAVEWLEL